MVEWGGEQSFAAIASGGHCKAGFYGVSRFGTNIKVLLGPIVGPSHKFGP